MNLNWSSRSVTETYEFTETEMLDEDCSPDEFQDTFILENADLAKLKMPGELIYSCKFSPQTSQKMMLNLVRNESLGCSLYIGSDVEHNPCFITFDKIRLDKSVYQIDQHWHGFVIENFLTEDQMDKMIDKDDDNILKLHLSFSLNSPRDAEALMKSMKADKIMVDQHEVNQMPFFNGFIQNINVSEEFESSTEDPSVYCSPNSPFKHMQEIFSVDGQEKRRTAPINCTNTAASDLINCTDIQQDDTSSVSSEVYAESDFGGEERSESTVQSFEQQADEEQQMFTKDDNVSVKEPPEKLYVRKKSKKFIPRILAEFLEFLTRRPIMTPF